MEFLEELEGYRLTGYLYINIGLTISAGFFVLMREDVRLDFLKAKGLENHKSTLMSSGRWKDVLKDLIILAMHPYPGLVGYRFYVYNKFIGCDIYYYYNDILAMLALCRFCYVLSKTFSVTRWQSCSADRICHMYGCEADTMFAIKALMTKHPFSFNACLMSLSILVFGQALRICEAPLSRVTHEMDHFDFINSVWAVILTMTTVGYGDIYPRTTPGRAIIFLCSITGIIVVSLVVVTVMNLFEMSKLEAKAFTIIKKLTLKNRMKEKAALIMTRLARLHLQIKRNKPLEVRKVFDLNNMIGAFRNDSRKYKNEDDEDQNELFYREFDKIKSGNQELLMYMSVLAQMIKASKPDVLDNLDCEDSQKIAKVLLDLQDFDRMKTLRDQKIMTGLKQEMAKSVFLATSTSGVSDYISYTADNGLVERTKIEKRRASKAGTSKNVSPRILTKKPNKVTKHSSSRNISKQTKNRINNQRKQPPADPNSTSSMDFKMKFKEDQKYREDQAQKERKDIDKLFSVTDSQEYAIGMNKKFDDSIRRDEEKKFSITVTKPGTTANLGQIDKKNDKGRHKKEPPENDYDDPCNDIRLDNSDDDMDTSRPLLTTEQLDLETVNVVVPEKKSGQKISQKVTSDIRSEKQSIQEEDDDDDSKIYQVYDEVDNSRLQAVIERKLKRDSRSGKDPFMILKDKGNNRQNREFVDY